jgi:broad specificity phosphatase PhoE
MIKMISKPFYFLRHGETDWNKKQIYMGSQDIPLNEEGQKQATTVYPYIKQEKITHIVSSPLKRALQTATMINEQMQLPLTIIQELQECSFGIWEGRSHNDGDFIEQWMNGVHPKDGEPRSVFENRVMYGLEKALEIDENVLIVSHGGVYACIASMMGWPVLDLKNCEPIIHQPDLSSQSWKIHSLLEERSRDDYT